MIYLDNAATSWPKPPGVVEAMAHFVESVGANPGRAAHRRALESGRIVYEAREAVCELFHAPDPLRTVWTKNVTEALNLVLHGLLRPGDHVVTSSMEHNSMMRPLRALEGLPNPGAGSIEVTVVRCSAQGVLEPAQVEAAIRPNTRLVALNHASNVVGTLLPVCEVGAICRRHQVLLLVDAAQTGGAYPIDMPADQIDLLAFTGHKSLGGPMGTGGLILGEGVDETQIEPLVRGGTGSHSEHEVQPGFLPDRFESGTLNVVGLAGLLAGLRWMLERSVEAIREHEVALTRLLIDGLRSIAGVTIHGTLAPERQTATVSFNVSGMSPSELGLRLEDDYGIMCRVGLHCAPAAHKTMGTFPEGTVRFGLSAFSTVEEVQAGIDAVRHLAQQVA